MKNENISDEKIFRQNSNYKFFSAFNACLFQWNAWKNPPHPLCIKHIEKTSIQIFTFWVSIFFLFLCHYWLLFQFKEKYQGSLSKKSDKVWRRESYLQQQEIKNFLPSLFFTITSLSKARLNSKKNGFYLACIIFSKQISVFQRETWLQQGYILNFVNPKSSITDLDWHFSTANFFLAKLFSLYFNVKYIFLKYLSIQKRSVYTHFLWRKETQS